MSFIMSLLSEGVLPLGKFLPVADSTPCIVISIVLLEAAARIFDFSLWLKEFL